MVKKTKKKQTIRLAVAPAKKNKTKPQRTQDGVSAVGKALRMLGGMGGTALGGLPGHAIGSGLGAALSQWLGHGDYTVGNNSVVNKAASGIPMMHKQGQTIVVRHREMLCEVTSSTAFSVQRSFVLNPGLGQTFPWLSRIAACFQEYTIKGMVFHYIPTSGTYTTSGAALGSVMLLTSYRSTDAAPASKVELLNEYCSNESVPSETFAHPIECDPAENPFNVQYIRSGPVPSGETQLMYDLGTTYLATSGQSVSGTTLGDLWVTYEIELRKPILESNVTSSPGWYASYVSPPPNLTTGIYFAAGTSSVGNIPITFDAARTFIIPRGYFGTFNVLLSFAAEATVVGHSLAGSPSVTGGTIVQFSPLASLTSLAIAANTCASGGAPTYAFTVYKPNRDADCTVIVPPSSVTSGNYAKTVFTLYGTTD